jgi:hypothetical protein
MMPRREAYGSHSSKMKHRQDSQEPVTRWKYPNHLRLIKRCSSSDSDRVPTFIVLRIRDYEYDWH